MSKYIGSLLATCNLSEKTWKLGEKFASEKHAGPADVVAFLDIEDREEQERIKQDAYQKVYFLVDKLQV